MENCRGAYWKFTLGRELGMEPGLVLVLVTTLGFQLILEVVMLMMVLW
jgi:hypothetical protein